MQESFAESGAQLACPAHTELPNSNKLQHTPPPHATSSTPSPTHKANSTILSIRIKWGLSAAIKWGLSASMRVGILRKTMSVFRDVTVVAKCFWAFILPVLEYCSPVWMSAATSHLSLLDRVVSQVGRLSGGSVSCDLWHRRRVASLSAFFKIDSLVDHPVRGLFPAQYVLRRPTRGALAAHSRSFEMPRSRTVQFSRSFVLSCVRLWNGLHESVFAGEGLGAFKTSVNRFLLQGWLPTVSSFSSTVSLSFFLFSGPKIAWGSSDL